MNTIELKIALKVALSAHLKNLSVTKAKISDQEFADLVADFRQRLLNNPDAYLAGVENSHHVKLVIESIIDEVAES